MSGNGERAPYTPGICKDVKGKGLRERAFVIDRFQKIYGGRSFVTGRGQRRRPGIVADNHEACYHMSTVPVNENR
jgi:hypothetical protein